MRVVDYTVVQSFPWLGVCADMHLSDSGGQKLCEVFGPLLIAMQCFLFNHL